MAKDSRHSTYHRIIDASLILFNEEGERNISTNHIASYLGISPGNLYYHFRNKDEIIMQLFKQYSQDLLTYLHETSLPKSIDTIKGYMLGIFDILWKYRFLFSDVNTLLARSGELMCEHNEFVRIKVAPLLLQLLEQLDNEGLTQTDDILRREISLNIWLITKYWFDFDSSMQIHKLAEESKFRGICQTLGLLRPYIRETYQSDFAKMMDSLSLEYNVVNNE